MRPLLGATCVAFAAAPLVQLACIDTDDCYLTRTCPTSSANAGGGPGSGGSSSVTSSGGNMGKALGEPCAEATECASDFCADTVCCESACDGSCQSCGSDGTCTPYAPGTDPETECAPGVCDGASLCAKGDHIWSKSFGASGPNVGTAVAADAQGNVYMLASLGGSSPVNFGGNDIAPPTTALVKYGPSGAHIWSTPLGQAQGKLHVAANGQLVLAGNTIGTVTCGGDGASSAGMSDVLIMRFDASGTCALADTWGDADGEGASGAASATDGATIVVGGFAGTLNLGNGALTSAGGTDAFVAKFNAANQLNWRVSFGGAGDEGASGVSVTPSGTIIVVGAFEGAIDVGATHLVSKGAADVVVAEFDNTGAAQWAKGFGSAADDVVVDATTDAGGAIVLLGAFLGPTIDFGGGTLMNMNAGSGTEMFLVKLDATGEHLFSANYGSADPELPTALSVDGNGSMVVTGFFDQSISFGGDTLVSAGFDVFVAKLASDGTHLWSKRFGDPEPDVPRGLATDADGNVIVTGSFTSTISFGGNVLTSVFAGDGFIAKLGP